jgi:predicted nuclease of predicted toxin-antitoxin system
MKIKLHENIPSALAELLCFHGHNVSTVPEEQLCKAEDSVVVERSTKEDRLLMKTASE